MVSFAVQKHLFNLVYSPLIFVFGVKSSKSKIDVKELTVSVISIWFWVLHSGL